MTMKHIKDSIKNKNKQLNSLPVNSKDKSLYTVNSNTVSKKIDEFIEQLEITPEGVAQKLAEDLGDLDSSDYYTILAKSTQPGRLLEALSYVKEAEQRGRIKTKKAIYFQGILRKWGIRTKFKEQK